MRYFVRPIQNDSLMRYTAFRWSLRCSDGHVCPDVLGVYVDRDEAQARADELNLASPSDPERAT